MSNLEELLKARNDAERAYNLVQNAEENDMANSMDEETGNEIMKRLYNAQQPWIKAANNYNNAIQENPSVSEEEKQISRDYVRTIEQIDKPASLGGRRRRSSTARKSSSRRGRRSSKKRATKRKPKRRQRRASRRAY